MRLLVVITILLIILASCQDVQRMKKPDDLIPPEKMSDVLLELSLLQGAKSISKSSFENLGIDPEAYLWERFDIDSIQLVESINYYSENYSDYQAIYLEVQQRLESMKVKYDSLIEIEREKIEDSLIKLSPADSLNRIREERFRDSILRLPADREPSLPEPASREMLIR